MDYFKHFPKVFHSRDNFVQDFEYVTNLCVRYKIFDDVLSNVSAFYDYTVTDGERPDTIAHKYYGDSTYAWLIIAANQYVNPLWEWPLTDAQFNSYIASEYGSVATAKADIEFYYKKLNGRKYIVDANQSYDETQTAFEFEQEINENRRQIKIIDRAYLDQIDRELKKIFE